MDAISISYYQGEHPELSEVVYDAEVELIKLEMGEESRIRKDPDIVIDEDLETDENSD